jgi:hypothetical protein
LPVNCSNVELAWHENVDLPIPPVGPGPKGNGLVSVFVWYPTIGSTRGNEALFQDCYLPYGCHEISELTAELCITVS